MNLERQEKDQITWKEAEADIAFITRSEGWEAVLTEYLMDHPEEIPKWYSLEMPVSPPPEEIFNRRLAEAMEEYPDNSKGKLERDVKATLIGYGWPAAIVEYRQRENPSQYFQEVVEWQGKRRSQEDPDLTLEEVQEQVGENWGKISSWYERNRIRVHAKTKKLKTQNHVLGT
jgi:hypothetical protein